MWTIRRLRRVQHAEAGGDMESTTIISGDMAELGLTLARILRGGFSYVRARAAHRSQGAARGWNRLSEALADLGAAIGSPRTVGLPSPPTWPGALSPTGWTT